MTDLGDLFKAAAEEKRKLKEQQENSQAGQALKAVQERLRSNNEIAELMEVFVERKQPVKEIIVEKEVVVEKEVLNTQSFQQPKPQPVDPNFAALTKKIQFLEQAIGRIAATGPGSGEVNLRYLDDVDRASIYDMRYMRYNATSKKFEFAEVNPHDIVYTTKLVTTSTYTVTSDDYYVGVNYAGPVTISLPTTLLSSGRTVIIKDESGAAETNPITVVGTVDNDAGGFIIQINNGATQLIYRNGWRII
jgi:transcription elongation GreA/GreB family factor